MLRDVRKVLPSFAEADRLLKHFMQTPSSTGCARAKEAITAYSAQERASGSSSARCRPHRQ